MFMLWLYRIMTGYVKFTMRGGFPERFLNLCAAKGITVWNVRRHGETVSGCVLAKQYPTLRPLVRKSGVRMRHTGCRGMTFLVRRYRHRYGIPAGALLFFGVLLFLSCFVWNVSIAGNSEIPDRKIMQTLSEIGVNVGAPISDIDVKNMRQKLLIRMPELSWAAINMEGSVIVVDVRETTQKPEFLDSGAPCNIKANRDGRILSIKPYQGSMAVQIGSAVVKGDLLVSGIMEYKTGVCKMIHARADVVAETERTLKVTVPYEQMRLVPDGKTDKRSVVSFLWWKIPLYLGQVDGEYRVERKVLQPSANGVSLPMSITTAEFSSVTREKYSLSKEQAVTRGEKILSKRAAKLPVMKYREKSRNIIEEKKGITLSITYLCEENIAYSEPLLIQ